MNSIMTVLGTARESQYAREDLDILLGLNERKMNRVALEEKHERIRDTDLYRDAWTIQDAIVDRHISTDSLFVRIKLDVETGTTIPVLMVSGDEYSFTATSFSQLCEKSGMGVASYMKKCLTSGLSYLIPQNLNAWLGSQTGKEMLVRVAGRRVIAFLSSKYGVFDHGDALECLSNALGTDHQYQIEAHALTLDNLSVRLVDPEKVLLKDASYGRDQSTAGLIFRNGQTGQSFASIEFLVYTFACTNGLIVAQDRGVVYKRRHISIDREDFTEQIAAALAQFPAYVASAREDMERARRVRITIEDQVSLKQRIQKGLSVGDDTVDEIFEVMQTQWDANAWGMAGAITEVAQKFSAERQYQFEKFAGELVRSLAA